MEVNDVDLALEDVQILRFIVTEDGATASEIREAFGIASSSSSSHRLDKLEEAGLIRTKRQQPDHPGRIRPRIAFPTDDGTQLVEAVPKQSESVPETLTAEERLRRLERQFETAREKILSLQHRINELEEQIDEQQFVFSEANR